MSCDIDIDTLSALLDGEIEPGERGELEGHVRDCLACGEQLRTLRAIKHAVSGLPAREPLHDASRARIEAALTRARARSVPWRFRRTAALALVAVTVLALAVWGGRSTTQSYEHDLLDDYARSVPADLPGEVVSNDREVVRGFFDGRVPFDPLVPALGDARLLGGRVCIIRGRATEMLFYERAETTLALFVVDHADAEGAQCAAANGDAVCARALGERRLMLVGPLPEAELERLIRDASL